MERPRQRLVVGKTFRRVYSFQDRQLPMASQNLKGFTQIAEIVFGAQRGR
jgi:hypothetical protein